MARWPPTVVPVAWRSRRSTTGSRACRCPRTAPRTSPTGPSPTTAPAWPTWSSPGVVRLTADELPRVRRSIDAGRPVVLGLVGARSLEEVGGNRQVVAYGYDDDGPGPGAGPP